MYFISSVLKWSVFFFFCKLDLCDGLSLFLELLPLFQVSFSHLSEVLVEQNFSLLTVLSLFSFFEDVLDVFLKLVWMANINKFQSVFYGDAPSSCNVVHQELGQVEKISGFKPSLVENATFIHEGEFILIDAAVQIFIDLPNPLIDLRLAEWKIKFCQDSDDVFLIKLIFGSKEINKGITGCGL